MSTTYSTADRAVTKQFEALLTRRFAELQDAGVTFCLLMADNAEGPAVKHHGVPAAAKIKVNSLQQRIEGLSDLTITIDADKWADLTERQRLAVLEHEATHVELKRDDGGSVETDDAGRPKIKLRPDDFCLNGFDSVVKEYGADAVEWQSINSVVQRWTQMNLWGNDGA